MSAATLAAIQIVIGGLLQGSLFALVALGFALVFRMTGVINLSQGAFCVLGALICYSLQETLRLPVPLAILGSVLAALLLGLALGATVFVPALSRLPNSSMLMLTAGLLTFIQGLMLVYWGGDPYALRPLSGEAPVQVLGVRVPSQGFWIAGTAALVIAAFWYLFARTTLGKALQASAENPTAARLMGIDVERMAVMSFGLAATIGALGGIMVAPILAVQFDTSKPVLHHLRLHLGGDRRHGLLRGRGGGRARARRRRAARRRLHLRPLQQRARPRPRPAAGDPALEAQRSLRRRPRAAQRRPGGAPRISRDRALERPRRRRARPRRCSR